MKARNIRRVPKTTNYFVHANGYVFTVRNGKDIIIPPRYVGARKVAVRVKGVEVDLLMLLLESRYRAALQRF